VPVKAERVRAYRASYTIAAGSGGAFFVEPQAVVEMNNRLRELQSEEREAMLAILRNSRRVVGGASEDLSPALMPVPIWISLLPKPLYRSA
jgi:DNA mismatch repair protein MutS2